MCTDFTIVLLLDAKIFFQKRHVTMVTWPVLSHWCCLHYCTLYSFLLPFITMSTSQITVMWLQSHYSNLECTFHSFRAPVQNTGWIRVESVWILGGISKQGPHTWVWWSETFIHKAKYFLWKLCSELSLFCFFVCVFIWQWEVTGEINQYSTMTPQSFPVFKQILRNLTRLTATNTLSYW